MRACAQGRQVDGEVDTTGRGPRPAAQAGPDLDGGHLQLCVHGPPFPSQSVELGFEPGHDYGTEAEALTEAAAISAEFDAHMHQDPVEEHYIGDPGEHFDIGTPAEMLSQVDATDASETIADVSMLPLNRDEDEVGGEAGGTDEGNFPVVSPLHNILFPLNNILNLRWLCLTN